MKTALNGDGIPLLNTQDPLRLVLHTGRAGINGLEADDWFMNHGLVAELPEPATLTFCLGLTKQRRLREKLRKQWTALKRTHQGKTPFPPFEPPVLPLVSALDISPSKAWSAARQAIPLEAAEDRLAAELLCPYPPGIPLLIPGERLDGDRLTWLLRQKMYWGKQIPEQLMVIEGMKSSEHHG